MIRVRAAAPSWEFEKLLSKTQEALKNALSISPSMSNLDFEKAAYKALKNEAGNTPFEGLVEELGDRDFPDIAVSNYYGVEVKKTTKAVAATIGNSIFESSRPEFIQEIYILLAFGDPPQVVWSPYEACINGIAVTHSPRYKISIKQDDEGNLFSRMGISYNEFRKLSQNEMMDRVKHEYGDNPDLWWLQQQVHQPYRFWDEIPKQDRDILWGEVAYLCPQIFSNSPSKYKKAASYLVLQGVICHNLRDLFSGGGQVSIDGHSVPKVFGNLQEKLSLVRRAENTLEYEIVQQFWPQSENVIWDRRGIYDGISHWKQLVYGAVKSQEESDFLEDWVRDLQF